MNKNIISVKTVVKFLYDHCPEEITSIFYREKLPNLGWHTLVLTDHRIWASGNPVNSYAHIPQTDDIDDAITSIINGFDAQAVGSKDIFWEVVELPDLPQNDEVHVKYIDENGKVVSQKDIEHILRP